MGVYLAGNQKDLAGNALVRGSAFIFSNVFMGVDLAGNLKDLAGNALVEAHSYFQICSWRGFGGESMPKSKRLGPRKKEQREIDYQPHPLTLTPIMNI